LLNYGSLTAVYIGLIVAFSSTMVVIKILSDRQELDTLHGRIIIGILLIQDIVAIIALLVLNNLANFSLETLFTILVKALLVVAVAYFLTDLVFPALFKFSAKSQELLFMLSVSVLFIFSLVFILIDFSIVIGAFIAGIMLGNLPYNLEIASRVKPLTHFFGVMFFAAIGTELVLMEFSKIITLLAALLALTLIGIPVITIIICSSFGYKKRTAFLTGIGMAQASEFSLILVQQGKMLGHIPPSIHVVTVLLAITTMGATAYFIKYEEKLYKAFAKHLKVFEKLSKHNRHQISYTATPNYKVVLVGLDRMGYSIYQKLKRMKKEFIVVDFNPEVIKRLIEQKVGCVYGDIGDPEIISKLNLKNVELVISTIPEHHESMLLIRKVKEINPEATVIVTSYAVEDALSLYEAGADYVLLPHFLGGEHMSLLLEDISKDLGRLMHKKIKHIQELKLRKEIHPHHR
jgi:Kef-type K+ transport system membrane component KefB